MGFLLDSLAARYFVLKQDHNQIYLLTSQSLSTVNNGNVIDYYVWVDYDGSTILSYISTTSDVKPMLPFTQTTMSLSSFQTAVGGTSLFYLGVGASTKYSDIHSVQRVLAVRYEQLEWKSVFTGELLNTTNVLPTSNGTGYVQYIKV
jgi:hypothetical protein